MILIIILTVLLIYINFYVPREILIFICFFLIKNYKNTKFIWLNKLVYFKILLLFNKKK